MINRCYNPNNSGFPRYGARGIKVCDRWRFGTDSQTGFECFLADMGERPGADYSIDRINNDGDYEPGNCRWATGDQQRLNRSVTNMVEIDGQTVPLARACANAGVPRKRVEARLRLGWPLDRALKENVHGAR